MSQVILFDGVCNLCSWSVKFIINNDKNAVFSFASLQSDFAKTRLMHVNGQDIKYNSVIYLDGAKVFIKSDAVFKIAEEFGGIWKLVNVFQLIPRRLRDLLYDFVANHRYQWFGKRDRCLVPSDEIAVRFLD